MTSVLLDIDTRGVAWLTLNRPEVFNAFDEEMIGRITETCLALANRDDVRAVVLQGAGKHFSAGADLGWMQRQSRQSAADSHADAERFAEMMRSVHELPQPTVARVQGAALGGGIGLACACDIVVSEDKARFAASEARFGILPAVISPYLINAVGQRAARFLALTARQIDGRQAEALGLAHEVGTASELDGLVEGVLSDLLANGPHALREAKTLFGRLGVGPIDAAVRALTADTIGRVRRGPEAQEGFAAFFEKRPPAWRSLPDG